jgi:hypothetical protein
MTIGFEIYTKNWCGQITVGTFWQRFSAKGDGYWWLIRGGPFEMYWSTE